LVGASEAMANKILKSLINRVGDLSQKGLPMRTHRFGVCISFAAFLTVASLNGQGLTGQISGTVQDTTGSAIVGAVVELTNAGTGLIRQAPTDASGSFVFPDLLAGTYNIKVTSTGFKTYGANGIALASQERSVLRPIVLQLGTRSESVTVTAETATLQTQSSERADTLTTTQILETPEKGRLFFNLLAMTPGVISTGVYEGPGDTSGGIGGIQINGSRAGSLTLTNDGIPDLDTGCQCGGPAIPNLETIAEVKVLLTAYQAEYGRNNGGMITTVTKAGSPRFHGGGFYFIRNEAMNADDFFANRQGAKRTRYRYQETGYYLGGPVLIPRLITTRDKLFFFWSQEYMPRTIPLGPTFYTFPTALERAGNFSQAVDTSGKVIPIEDPLNNKVQFPGNIIPSNRLNAAGIGLLSVFPLPNTISPSHTFNSVIQGSQSEPHRFEVLRVDWNLGKTAFYIRGLFNHDTRSSNNWFNSFPVSNTFPLIQGSYNYPSKGLVFTAIHTFSPTLVNELTAGIMRYTQDPFAPYSSSLARVNRATLGINFPQFHPELNPLNVIPNATFTDVQSPPSIAWEGRWIFYGTDTPKSFSDNLTKIYGTHNVKMGFYYENTSRNAAATGGPLMGTAAFGRDVNDPLDSNYGFSNAALGTLTSYSEANTKLAEHARSYHAEGFIQDSWRVSKRLTVDVGFRFYHIATSSNAGTYLASFEPSQYSAKAAAKLIQPYIAPGGVRMGIDPATGALSPAVTIGALAPGSGTFFDGMQKYWESIMTAPAFTVTPRGGFSWDVFGDGKTAVRGGVGIFPGVLGDDTTTANFVAQPPILQTSTLYYTTIPSLLNGAAYITPANVRATQHHDEYPTTYNASFGIQRDIGFHTVLDVSYVVSLGRHLLQTRSLNAVPYGSDLLASSIDTTLTGNTPLPLNFMRPVQGFGDISYYELSSSSNYHSLQTSMRRRFQHGFLLGLAWTWSKSMDYVATSGTVDPFTNYAQWNYGKSATDRTHVLVVNYDYMIPNLSGVWRSGFAKVIGDGWGISGITTLESGVPLGISYTLVSTTNLTHGGGAGVETRVNVLGLVTLPHSQRSDVRAFNTAMIGAPPLFGLGNAPKDVFRGPGKNDFDVMLTRNFRFGHEGSKTIEFRFESYNIFNHPNFVGVDTTARFDANGNQTNSDFGAYTSTDGNPRKLQLGLKFGF
jgi:hypothetical protein